MSKWKTVKLSEITELITKGTTPTTLGYSFQDQGINFVKIESITDSGEFIQSKFQHISNECDEKLKRSRLHEHDILFSIAGALGRTAIVNRKILPANTNQALSIIRLNRKNIFPIYLQYSLKSDAIYQQFQKQKQGVAQLNLSLKNIGDLEIPFPPIETQVQIAKTLDTASELLAMRKQQLAELDKLIKSTFYDMFGDPVTNEKGWEIEKLMNITTKIGSGATPKGGKEGYKNEGISLIRSMNIHNGEFKYSQLAYIDDNQARKLDIVKVEDYDVLINITGASVARSCIVPSNVLPARVNQHVSILRLIKMKANPEYINNMLISGSYQTLLLSIGGAGGATREAITKQQLQELDVPLPPIEIQIRFSKIIRKIEEQKNLVKKALTETLYLFDSLMSQYFE